MRHALRSGIVMAVSLLAALLCVARVQADTRIETQLDLDRVEVGATVHFVVAVHEPRGNVADPQVTLPAGLEMLGMARSQQFSFVNGRASNEVQFQYSIGAVRPGTFAVGPVRVAIGGQVFRSPERTLVVTPATAGAPSTGGGGGAVASGRRTRVASLVLTLEPREPVVGQLCRLRVQLIQRVPMAEDSQYGAPGTPGFWSETWGDVTRYEAREGRQPVLVMETAVRLYPLAAGLARIDPAGAVVTPAGGGGLLDVLSGVSSNRIEIMSDSLKVAVRPLPGGAPTGFDGAVGRYRVTWTADRSHTAQDQAITVRFTVHGVGNLPLLRTPAYAPDGFEVFAATVEDSLPRAGEVGEGRRTFVWTLLPRHAGEMRIPAPTFVWFDPETGRYDSTTPSALALQVIAPGAAESKEDGTGLPLALRQHAAQPGGRAAWPLLAWLGGALVAAACEVWRRSRAADPLAAQRAQQREWLRAVGLAQGPDFWRAADEAAAWLQSRGDTVHWLREAIQSARYGGGTHTEEEVRRKMVEHLARSLPAPVVRWPRQVIAGALAVVGCVLFVFALPRGGSSAMVERARAADALVAQGHVDEAQTAWAHLWDEQPGDAALAARLTHIFKNNLRCTMRAK